MLVLARRKDEAIVIHDLVTVRVLKIAGEYVRLGIEAPREISVHREEIQLRVDRDANEGDAA